MFYLESVLLYHTVEIPLHSWFGCFFSFCLLPQIPDEVPSSHACAHIINLVLSMRNFLKWKDLHLVFKNRDRAGDDGSNRDRNGALPPAPSLGHLLLPLISAPWSPQGSGSPYSSSSSPGTVPPLQLSSSVLARMFFPQMSTWLFPSLPTDLCSNVNISVRASLAHHIKQHTLSGQATHLHLTHCMVTFYLFIKVSRKRTSAPRRRGKAAVFAAVH